MKLNFTFCLRLAVLAWLGFAASPGAWAQDGKTNLLSADVATATTQTASATNTNSATNNYLTFGLDRVAVLSEYHPFGEPLWKYAASVVYILLAFFVSWFFDCIVGVWLKRWAEKTETKYDDLMLELLRGPIKVVLFVIFLHVGLNMFDWPVKAREFLSKGLVVIVACSITYVALKVVDLFLNLWRDRQASTEDKLFSEHLLPLIRKSTKVVLIIVATLLTADNLGIEIKTVLAGLSVGGLALGLAAQDTIGNLFGAVAIILDKPFHIGDRIKVDSTEGMVENIGLRSTRIRSLDGNLVTIPNKAMGNATIINVTRRPTIKTEMNIGIVYATPADKVKRAAVVLEEIFRAHPKTTDLIISFNKFNDSALNILVVHWWNGTDAKVHFAGMQEFNLAIKQRFDAEKIEFAYPTQTVYVKQEGGAAHPPA